MVNKERRITANKPMMAAGVLALNCTPKTKMKTSSIARLPMTDLVIPIRRDAKGRTLTLYLLGIIISNIPVCCSCLMRCLFDDSEKKFYYIKIRRM